MRRWSYGTIKSWPRVVLVTLLRGRRQRDHTFPALPDAYEVCSDVCGKLFVIAVLRMRVWVLRDVLAWSMYFVFTFTSFQWPQFRNLTP